MGTKKIKKELKRREKANPRFPKTDPLATSLRGVALNERRSKR